MTGGSGAGGAGVQCRTLRDAIGLHSPQLSKLLSEVCYASARVCADVAPLWPQRVVAPLCCSDETEWTESGDSAVDKSPMRH